FQRLYPCASDSKILGSRTVRQFQVFARGELQFKLVTATRRSPLKIAARKIDKECCVRSRSHRLVDFDR
ncbi:MAG: hypothetical protein MUE44_21930, partial [Oscillatoriaceae cyanobacterium Prado104]|nr:hypothetical protein [Oscillatoriaceae cyanobacterium Prado104]